MCCWAAVSTRSCCSPRSPEYGAAGTTGRTPQRTRSWTHWLRTGGRGGWRRCRCRGGGGGLAVKPGGETKAAGFDPGQLTRQGLPLMVPERAFAGLQQVLDGDEVCTAVAEVDWTRFVPVFTSARPSRLLSRSEEH